MNTTSFAIASAALLGCLQAVPVAAQGVPAFDLSAKAPGLYVQVLDGMIQVTNPSGAQNFAGGQFGYTSGARQPPTVLPTNPGIQFTPPSSFINGAGTSTPGSGTSASSKSNTVDCIVQ